MVRSGLSDDILWGGLQKLKYYMMEKLLLTLRGATEIMAVLLVVMYQER